MINDLRYAVSFPTNGVQLRGELSFQPGSTAISGANGTGKSFVAEMIRYGLFGAKARRGPTSDYKSLDMSLMFEVNGSTYFVVRAKKEQLESDGEILAVGADAVNKKIIEILGFDLEVFDVVCAANQKESERLTRLTPAKRKELIDNVVGLTTQEQAEKACRDEAKGLAREAEALTRALVPPVEPVKPDLYEPSATLKAELDETIAVLAQLVKLQRVIDAVPPEPQHPGGSECDVETIEKHEHERIRREAQRAALERQLAGIPDPKFTAAQLDEADALAEYDAEVVRRGPKPGLGLSEDVIVTTLGLWAKHRALEEIGDIELNCPNCGAGFEPGHSSIPPAIDEQRLQDELKRVRAWAEPLIEPKGTRLSPEERSTGRMALALAGDKPRLEKELAELKPLPDCSAELAFARETNQKLAIYEAALSQYESRLIDADHARDERAQLPTPKRTPEDLNALYTEARVYEERLTDYEIAKERFDELTAEIAEKQERADAFMAGARGLVEARRTLKAFLAPSLSRVASHLISQMTANSQRPLYSIIVDEDMNITADGQDISTFNGAHATMINLALRLALGQVLVSRVFPVFIGDEIDSDADEANAQAIADALSACKDQVKQIVLISHKRLEGVDHEVML
jgi:DNA repair exonuclease SbcCD ATPase subunit